MAASPTPREEPVYQVFMPPLAFDASAKVQPEPDLRFIVLVRRVRVRPTLIYRGRVEGEPVNSPAPAIVANAATLAAPAAVAPKPSHSPAAKNADSSMYTRVRGFFHRLWTRGPEH